MFPGLPGGPRGGKGARPAQCPMRKHSSPRKFQLGWWAPSEQSPVVITGSSDGHIDVYRMVNLDGGLLTAKEQATNLEHVSCVPNCVCHCLFFRSRPAYHTDRAFMIRNSALQITSLARVIRLFKRTLNERVEPVELQCTGST